MGREKDGKRQVDRSKWTLDEERAAELESRLSFEIDALARIRGGDDWSKVVQSHLFFDHVITKMLEEELARPDRIDLDRLSFAAKVDLCAGLGLIGDQLIGVLRAINRLRNNLAHDLSVQVTKQNVDKLYEMASAEERELIDEQRVIFPNDSVLFRILATLLLSLDLRRQAIATRRSERDMALQEVKALLEQFNIQQRG